MTAVAPGAGSGAAADPADADGAGTPGGLRRSLPAGFVSAILAGIRPSIVSTMRSSLLLSPWLSLTRWTEPTAPSMFTCPSLTGVLTPLTMTSALGGSTCRKNRLLWIAAEVVAGDATNASDGAAARA